MRLTSELILRSPSYFNPIKEREIDLRGNKISVLENLGTTQDQYDCIDLSDNEITKLENFPLLNRLRTLFLNTNRIAKIVPNLGESLVNLETLILNNNKLINLSDIDNLADLPSLKRLSLLDNLITKKQHYRLYVINKLPHLKLLDFRKIKQKERVAAQKLFGPSAEKSKKRKATDSISQEAKKTSGLTSQEVVAIKTAIQNAKSMEEFAELESSLQQGKIPKILKQGGTE